MSQVLELVKAARVVGVKPMLRLRRAQRLAWEGMINGFYATRVMQTLFNVGFFDELQKAGSIDPKAFARQHTLDGGILTSLADAMYSFGVLDTRGGGSYVLTENGHLLVDVARGWFDGIYGYHDLMTQLESLVTGERTYGTNIDRKSVHVARGSGAIESLIYFPLAIDEIRRQGFTRALDLGCGDGTFLRHLVRTDPSMTGYGIDLSPEAVADGIEQTKAAGLGGRVHLFAEDIARLERVPEALQGIQVATIFFVLHELLYAGEEHVVRFLSDFRRLFPGVPLIVFEVDRPTPEQMRQRPGMAIPYYLHHDLSHQRPIAKEQWRPIFEAAGFTSIEQRDLAFARSVIFTVR